MTYDNRLKPGSLVLSQEIAINMRDHFESIAGRLRLWSPAMFVSAAAFQLGAIIALVMLFVRPAIVGETGLSNGSQVILILVSWLVAFLLVHESCSTPRSWRWIPYVCSGLITIALMSWSVSVPIALAVASPIVFANAGNAVFEFMDWHTISGPASQQSNRLVNSGSGTEAIPGVQPAAESGFSAATNEMFTQNDAGETDGSDLWESVKREFTSDSNLSHNVSRWTGEDGDQSLVAIIRCHLKPGSRTAAIQLPVWPFMPGIPEVFCRVIDGDANEVRVTQKRPNGIAAEAVWPKMNDSGIPQTAIIELVAMARAGESCSESAA